MVDARGSMMSFAVRKDAAGEVGGGLHVARNEGCLNALCFEVRGSFSLQRVKRPHITPKNPLLLISSLHLHLHRAMTRAIELEIFRA